MAHTHTWIVQQYLLLSLPDCEGLSERFVQWRCTTCALRYEIDGAVRHGSPLMTPPFWGAADPASRVRATADARRVVRAQRR